MQSGRARASRVREPERLFSLAYSERRLTHEGAHASQVGGRRKEERRALSVRAAHNREIRGRYQ